MPRKAGYIDLGFAATVDLSSEPLMVPPDRLLMSRDVVHDVGGVPRTRPARAEGASPTVPVGFDAFDPGNAEVFAALAREDEFAVVGKGGLYRWNEHSEVFELPGDGEGRTQVRTYAVDSYPFSVSGPGTVRHVEACMLNERYLCTAYITQRDADTTHAVRVRVYDIQDEITVGDLEVDDDVAVLDEGGCLAIFEASDVSAYIAFLPGSGTNYVHVAQVYVRAFSNPSWMYTIGPVAVSDGSHSVNAGTGFRACPGGTDGIWYMAFHASSVTRVFRMTGRSSFSHQVGFAHDGVPSSGSPDVCLDAVNSLVWVAAPDSLGNVDLHSFDPDDLTSNANTANAIAAGGSASYESAMVTPVNGHVFVAGVEYDTTNLTRYFRGKVYSSAHSEVLDTGLIHKISALGMAGQVDGLPLIAAVNREAPGVGVLASIGHDSGSTAYVVPVGRFGNDSLDHVDADTAISCKVRSAERYGDNQFACFAYAKKGIGWETDIVTLIIRTGQPWRTKSASYAGIAYASGSHLTQYDGVSYTEADWPWKPIIRHVQSSGGSGDDLHAIESGIWSFRAVFCWIDSAGRLHRSSPSDAVTKSFSSSGAAEVNVHMPQLTSYLSNAHGSPPLNGMREFYVEVYGKAPSDPNHTIMSDDGVTSLQDTDSSYGATENLAAFSDLYYDSSAAVIYTEPEDTGELAAEPSPPVHDLEIIGDRLWLINAENRNDLWPSKLNSPGIAYEFNAALVQTVPGVAMEALSQHNGQPLILRRDGLLLMYGDGPNNAGVNGEWSPARFVTGAPGCVSKQSVVRIPQGVVYQSDRGFFVLSPDLSVQDISGPALNRHIQGLTIRSATYSERDHRVVFWVDGSQGDECLCYDTQTGIWSTWQTGRDTLCAVQVPSGKVFALDQDGTAVDLSTYETGTYDSETGLNPKWRTAWLQPAGIHGRVEWEAIVLSLRYVGPHHLRVSVYGDGDDSSPVATATLTDPDAERRGDVYTVWVESIFQDPSARISRSIMVEIEIDRDAPESTLTEGARLVSGRVLYSTDGQTHRHQVTSAGRM